MLHWKVIDYTDTIFYVYSLWHCLDCGSRSICKYAWDISSFVNLVPPARVAKRSSSFGNGNWSTWRTGFTATLKSSQMQIDWSSFGTGMIGAAQSLWFTFLITLNCCSCFKSHSIASFKEYGTEWGLNNLGVVSCSITKLGMNTSTNYQAHSWKSLCISVTGYLVLYSGIWYSSNPGW